MHKLTCCSLHRDEAFPPPALRWLSNRFLTPGELNPNACTSPDVSSQSIFFSKQQVEGEPAEVSAVVSLRFQGAAVTYFWDHSPSPF